MSDGNGEGETHYALVSGGAILCLCGPRAERPRNGDFSDEFPADSKWLPIVNVDSDRFDGVNHQRIAVCYEVNCDHVSRVLLTRRW
jgi:hypothetical protein